MIVKIEVVDSETGTVTHSVDVKGRPERQIERIEDGMNINLDHERFFTRLVSEPDAS